jgi:hypothetical protein
LPGLPTLPKIAEIEMMATRQVFNLDFLAIPAILAIPETVDA